MKNSSYYIAPAGDRTHDLPHTVASNMAKVSHVLTHSALTSRVAWSPQCICGSGCYHTWWHRLSHIGSPRESCPWGVQPWIEMFLQACGTYVCYAYCRPVHRISTFSSNFVPKILNFIDVTSCCTFYQSVSSFISLSQAKASCRLSGVFVCSPTFVLKSPIQDLINYNVEIARCPFIWVRRRWCIYLNDLQLYNVLCVYQVLLLWNSLRLLLLCCISTSCSLGSLHLL